MSRKIKSSIASFLVMLFVLLNPAQAFTAEIDSEKEKVTTDLKKNDKAPYAGVLLSLRLAAEIKENCNPETLKQRCDIMVLEAELLRNSDCKKRTDILDARLAAAQDKHVEVVAAKDALIDLLRGNGPKWYEDNKLWFVMGFVLGGGAITLAVRNLNN